MVDIVSIMIVVGLIGFVLFCIWMPPAEVGYYQPDGHDEFNYSPPTGGSGIKDESTSS